MDRQKGTVQWFDPERGYGFIEPDEGEEDVFVHQSEISGEGLSTLNEGDRVSYSVEMREKGPRASDVEKVDGEGGEEEDAPEAGAGPADASLEAEREEEAIGDDELTSVERGAREAGEEIEPLDERFDR